MICETTDFLFPLLADIYYPIVEQSGYGAVKKQWIHDKTVACYLGTNSSYAKKEVLPNANILIELNLQGRTRNDLRISKQENNKAITNIIITNIRDTNGNILYKETSGVRSGKSTLFELATIDPFVGIFGKVEYYNINLVRSENQGDDI